jgi:hypothetical protein
LFEVMWPESRSSLVTPSAVVLAACVVAIVYSLPKIPITGLFCVSGLGLSSSLVHLAVSFGQVLVIPFSS